MLCIFAGIFMFLIAPSMKHRASAKWSAHREWNGNIEIIARWRLLPAAYCSNLQSPGLTSPIYCCFFVSRVNTIVLRRSQSVDSQFHVRQSNKKVTPAIYELAIYLVSCANLSDAHSQMRKFTEGLKILHGCRFLFPTRRRKLNTTRGDMRK